MRIWRDGKAQVMTGYSLVEEFLRSLVVSRRTGPAPTPRTDELSPEERLFIIHQAKDLPDEPTDGPREPMWLPTHLAALYLDCACFDEAYAGFAEMRHHRKLGDMAWARGELDLAATHYADVSFGHQSYRTGPDADRLMRLSFVRNDPDALLDWFDELGIAPESQDRAWVNGAPASTRPYLDMLAVLTRTRPEAFDEEFLAGLEELFLLTPAEWSAYAGDPRFDDPAFVAALREKCLPTPCRRAKVALSTALAQGDTGRSRLVLDTVLHIDRIVDEAQDALERYATTGSEADLQTWAGLVLRTGISHIVQDMLFRSLGHGSYEADPALIDRLRDCHPSIRAGLACLSRGRRDPRKGF